MDRSVIKLAAYLDEAGEEPDKGCKTLNDEGIFYTALRHVWTNNICEINDSSHKRLYKIINSYNMSVIMIASELGKVNAANLPSITDQEIDKVINICRHYGASFVRVYIGQRNVNISIKEIDIWMNRVGEKCTKNNITPLYEITSDSYADKAAEVAELLATHKQWKLLYDPVSLIIKQNINPFIKYWTLLKSHVEIIDVRDMKIGKGFKPPGFGDSKIDLTIKDAIQSKFGGWFMIESSLGRKHGAAVTKSDTFKYAIEGFDGILNSL